jgi:hypothetical protein
MMHLGKVSHSCFKQFLLMCGEGFSVFLINVSMGVDVK